MLPGSNLTTVPDEIDVVVLGLNHITAPIKLRDRAHFSLQDVQAMTKAVLRESGFHELVVLSTCNRSEVYAVTSRRNSRKRLLEEKWCVVKGLNPDELSSHSYFYRNEKAVDHLFRVISSLDSMVVGENQILGQVKEAYEQACRNHSVDFFCNYLFQTALRVGKRIRAETELNQGAISISSAAVELAKKVLGKSMKEKVVGVVGSGEMGELTAFHLSEEGISRFIFFNRSLCNAEKSVDRFGGEMYTLNHLSDKLFLCDIVISCTASREPVIRKEHVKYAIHRRNGKPLFLIDIAVPGDIEESIQEVKNIFLFTLDDLKNVVNQNQMYRRVAAEKALHIIREETERVRNWQINISLGTVIKKLKRKFQKVTTDELNRNVRNQPPEIRAELEKISRCLMGKFLHVSVSGMKRMGAEIGGKRAGQYVEQIFSLNQ